jgi:hypothetical protein
MAAGKTGPESYISRGGGLRGAAVCPGHVNNNTAEKRAALLQNNGSMPVVLHLVRHGLYVFFHWPALGSRLIINNLLINKIDFCRFWRPIIQ